jgi:hypothetical protein
MGIALGLNLITLLIPHTWVFCLHIITGSIAGAILGAIATKWKKTSLLNPYKETSVGIGAGITIWLILFLPITTLLIQPSINRIVTIVAVQTHQRILSDNINQFIRSIAISAIVFHMMWGAIFGFIISSLLRIKVLQSSGIKE